MPSAIKTHAVRRLKKTIHRGETILIFNVTTASTKINTSSMRYASI